MNRDVRDSFFNHGWTRRDTDTEDETSAGRVFIRANPCPSVVNTVWKRVTTNGHERTRITEETPFFQGLNVWFFIRVISCPFVVQILNHG